MRVAFVVPRYGTAIIGGAETAARLLAEHLVSGQGWTVEVLTTCAEDFTTWEEVYPAGTETINGVHVERVAAEAGRDPSFHPLSAGLLADPGRATLADAERWVDLQGPKAPALVERATSVTADVVVFYPYLYYPTVRAIGRTRSPAVLHPAAHDEPALQLPVFDRVLTAADGLVFQTEAERQLVQRRVPVASHLQLLLGLGVDDPDARRAGGGSSSGRASARAAARPRTRTCCASAGSTGTRACISSSTCSPPTRRDIPARSAWSWPARSSTHRPPGPTSTSSARCPRMTSGTC